MALNVLNDNGIDNESKDASTGLELARIDQFQKGPGKGGRRGQILAGIAWCVVGGVSASVSPLVSTMAVGYGTASATAHHGQTGARVSALCVVGAAHVTGLLVALSSDHATGADAAASVALPCLISWGCASAAAARKLSFRRMGVLTLAGALLLAILAEAESALNGTHLPDVVYQTIQSVVPGYVSTPVRTVAGTVMPSLADLWPSFFVIASGVLLAGALIGTYVGLRGDRDSLQNLPHLRDLRMPIWVNTALLVGLAGLVVNGFYSKAPAMVALVSANAVTILRLCVAADGIAVLAWFLHAKRTTPVVSFFAVAAAVYAEVAFYVMSVVGFLDVLADFRQMYQAKRKDGRESDR